jgi:hypothetical protein
MFISLCDATRGLSLPSHDMLAVLTTQKTFYGRMMAKIKMIVTDNDSVMSDDGESGE